MLNFQKNTGPKQSKRTWVLPAWLWLCLILGGASQGGMLANAILQLGATFIIALWIWRGDRLPLQRTDAVPLAILAAALLWVVIMFIPLPPMLWQNLPGRQFVTQGYRLLDIELPWLSIALPDKESRGTLEDLAFLAQHLVLTLQLA